MKDITNAVTGKKGKEFGATLTSISSELRENSNGKGYRNCGISFEVNGKTYTSGAMMNEANYQLAKEASANGEFDLIGKNLLTQGFAGDNGNMLFTVSHLTYGERVSADIFGLGAEVAATEPATAVGA